MGMQCLGPLVKLLRDLWCDDVVPFWKQLVELHSGSNYFLHHVGCFASSFVDAPDNVHCCAKD